MKRLLLYTLTWIISSGMVRSDSLLDKITHVGCYDIEHSLGHKFHHKMVGMTIDACVDFCCRKNSTYAGVEQRDDFCYCLGKITEESIKRNDSLCNVRCRGKDNMLCGGAWLMSLYNISGVCGVSCTPSSDIGQVRFLASSLKDLRLYQECSKDYDLLQTDNYLITTVDYHYTKNLVFYMDNNRLYKTTFQPVSPDNAVGLLHEIKNITYCEGFAVDWVSDRIYWADCENNTIMATDLDGKGDNIVLNRIGQQKNIQFMEVDPYGGMLFWATYGIIESCNVGDFTYLRTHVSRKGDKVDLLTLDIAAHRVYYVLSGMDSLFSMNYQGGDQQEILSMTELHGVSCLGLLNGNVYWANYGHSGEVLYKSSLSDPDSLQVITSIGKYIRHMKVVHPSLQQRPSVTTDPCKDKHCSNCCVVESPTTAICRPDNKILDTDGINSTGVVISDSLLDKINHVGCYDIEHSLGQKLHHKMTEMTIDACVDFCCSKNSPYAGVEQSDGFCYCGGNIAGNSYKMNDSLCNVRCRGKDKMMCGGAWLMSLYNISGVCGVSCTPSSDIGHVRFLASMFEEVRLYEECSKDYDLLHIDMHWISTVDYHYTKDLFFYVDNKRLYKTTFQPVLPDKAVGRFHPIKNITYCDGFTVDWVSDRIYWADCEKNNIMSMDLDGEGDTIILNRMDVRRDIKLMEVDPYKGMLFWTTYGIIESCNLGDLTYLRMYVSRKGHTVVSLTLDMAARRVYYVLSGSGTLSSMNYHGGDQREILSMTELHGVSGLGLLNGNIYWVIYNNSNEILYKSSLSDPDSVQVLNTIEKGVSQMKVVHPSLQQRPKVTTDPCEDKQCSHACVAESPTTAICQCPDNQTLDTDGITCTMNVNATSPTGSVNSVSVSAILLAILLVMVIVMVSGLLLYLVNKNWSHLNRKFRGASYTRKRNSVTEDESIHYASNTSNPTEDNVVLIS